ncbi:MAG: DUF1499 domain-containing protein [Devosiaceae bacterium]|nr:DUF1499 domain-containing protein [Devosiaceae bacterium]
MRTFTRTSKLAIWSRRFGSFALPIAIIPVWMHRNQLLNSETFQILLMSAVTLALLAVFIGIAAYFRLWQTGDHGWGKSTMGIFLGLICLSPIAYGASLALNYPFANDVSSNIQRPPQLLANLQTAVRTTLSQEETAIFFPAISTRIYEMGPEVLFEAVEDLVRERGWEIRIQRKPGANSTGTINAMAMTFLGWRDEVAIRLEPNISGTRFDMRSASLNGAHDLGANGIRVEKFLTDLDGVVLEIKETGSHAERTQNSLDADAPVSDPH